MVESVYPHKVMLAASSFRFPERHLLFSKARLYPDRIELSGWDSSGTLRQTIPLEHIKDVRWGEEPASDHAELHLHDGSKVALVLRNKDLWKQLLDQRLRWIRTLGDRTDAAGWTADLPPNELINTRPVSRKVRT